MKETRVIQSDFEIREAQGDTPKALSGIAAVINSPTVMFESEWDGKKEIYKEVILPGAFDGVMNDDVRALFNHDSSKILGRTTSKTLRISLSEKGLGYDVDLPDTTYANDLAVSVARRDITQSSFGFIVEEDLRQVEETETDVTYTRQIVRFKQLLDVSPVTFPAYEDTVTEMKREAEKIMVEMRSEKQQTEKHIGTPNLTACNLKSRINQIKNSL